MSRSIKKGPFCDASLMKKVEEQNKANKHDVIKTWSRRHKLGEFVATRKFGGHGDSKVVSAAAASSAPAASK